MAVIILLLGAFSSITLIMSGLSTERKKMLLYGIATSLLCVVMYALSNSPVALVICCIGIVRSLTAVVGLKHPIFNTWPFLVGFLVAQTVAFVLTADWNHFTITSALPVIGAYLGTIAVFAQRMAITKSLMISSGLVWLTYQFSAGFYTQMIGESFTVFANTFALLMVLKAEKAGVTEEGMQEVEAQVIGVMTGSIPIIAVKEALTGSIPVIKVSTDTKPLTIVAKVSAPTKINFPETGSLQQVPA
jgi:hypothetical protein